MPDADESTIEHSAEPAPSAAELHAKNQKWSTIMAIAGAVIVVCAFLPWATAGPFSVNGVDGDGQITLVAGALVAVMGWVRRSQTVPSGTPHAVGTIAAAIVVAIGVYDWFNISSDVEDSFISVSPGIGLIGTAVAGAVAFGAGLNLPVASKFTGPRPPSPEQTTHLPPAGWHPQQDGRLRYWDGQQWTEQYADPVIDPPEPAQADAEVASERLPGTESAAGDVGTESDGDPAS